MSDITLPPKSHFALIAAEASSPADGRIRELLVRSAIADAYFQGRRDAEADFRKAWGLKAAS